MQYAFAVILSGAGTLVGLGRAANWLTWSPSQWDAFTDDRTPRGILRWLAYEAVFAVFWLGAIVLGIRLW
jgi:hypothetical protein